MNPQEDSITNSKKMKELLDYHEDLEKSFSDKQKETFRNSRLLERIYEFSRGGYIYKCLQTWHTN